MRWLRGGILASALALQGCASVGYYAQSVGGHLELMHSRRPIAETVADPATPEAVRQQLQRVADVRAFASRTLALPDNDSYRLYAALGREAVVWSVVATPEFSVQPRTWCYPVIGCAEYRGYFDPAEADAYAAGLATEGLDVTVLPVPAYSTLGWFDDPLPSTVIQWSEGRLAGLIFHELAHQRLYLQGDSPFNESFATAVERLGVNAWLGAQPDGAGRLEAWEQSRRREQTFVGLLLATRDRLEALYRSEQGPEAMRRAKAGLFAGLRRDYARLKAGWGGYAGFDAWFDRPLNNARLASVATYEAWVPAFEALFEHSGRRWPEFYQAAEVLSRLAPAEREAEMRRLAASLGQAGLGANSLARFIAGSNERAATPLNHAYDR